MATDGAESPATSGTASSPATNAAVAGTKNETAVLALLARTGYPLVQENGQRKYGPPPDWPADKPPPARGCEVFIGKIPCDCFEVGYCKQCHVERRKSRDFGALRQSHTVQSHSFCTVNTPCLTVHQTAPPLTSNNSHLIEGYYSFNDPKRMKG